MKRSGLWILAVALVLSVVLSVAACSAPAATSTGTQPPLNAAPSATALAPTGTPTLAAPSATPAAQPTIQQPTAQPIPPSMTTPPQASTIGQRTKTTGCQANGPLPDSACSPGAIFATATKDQICQPGYSRDVRDVPESEKNQVYAEYGIRSHTTGEYEVDHLISLELGGSNDIANLWPEAAEPRPGYHEKDKVENYLHDQVCSGAMPLQEAQQEIATNWLAVYQRMTGTGAGAVPGAPLPVAPPQPAATAVPSPAPPVTTNLTLQIVSVTSPVAPGGRATLVAHTAPGANCTITLRYKAGPGSAAGLGPKTADDSGNVTWLWTVGPNTTPGTWPITVTATSGGNTATSQTSFVVAK